MLKLYDFMIDKNVVTTTPTIPAPEQKYVELYDVIEAALEHEYTVTAAYEKACELALAEPCHQCYQLFQWFVKEQVEEEAVFKTICDKYNFIKKYGITGAAILEFDNMLGDLA
jgi:ferritin